MAAVRPQPAALLAADVADVELLRGRKAPLHLAHGALDGAHGGLGPPQVIALGGDPVVRYELYAAEEASSRRRADRSGAELLGRFVEQPRELRGRTYLCEARRKEWLGGATKRRHRCWRSRRRVGNPDLGLGERRVQLSGARLDAPCDRRRARDDRERGTAGDELPPPHAQQGSRDWT